MNESNRQAPVDRGADIEVQIVQTLVEQTGVESALVEVEDNLLTSGLVDSVGMMRLIADLEEALAVTVPPQDLVPENFRTIRVMAAYLGSLQDPPPSS